MDISRSLYLRLPYPHRQTFQSKFKRVRYVPRAELPRPIDQYLKTLNLSRWIKDFVLREMTGLYGLTIWGDYLSFQSVAYRKKYDKLD